MKNRVPSFLLEKFPPGSLQRDLGRMKIPFIEKGIHHVSCLIKTGYVQWELSSQKGLFQEMDARVKVLFLIFFVIIVSLKRDFLPEIYIGILVLVLAFLSRLSLVTFYRRVLFFGIVFGFLIALPSALNVITKGKIIVPIVKLSKPHHFWIYHIPAEIGLTREGIYGVATLTMRVINSLSLSFLVLCTTPFAEIIRALKVLKVPDSFLLIITLAYKYIFIFSKTLEDMHLAKKSRMIRELRNTKEREWVAGRLAFLFKKSRLRCEEVFNAMIARAFSDTIRLYGFRKMRAADWFAGVFLFAMGLLFLLI
jgi:cobalt ECF transporter T component CbiQ